MNEESKKSDGLSPLLGKLMHAAGNVEASLETALAKTGLNLSKFVVLDHLINAGEPLPFTRLAERMTCVKSNITALVDKLEKDGLVARMDDPNDRRSVLAVINDEGRRRYKIANKALTETCQQLQKPLQKSELEILNNLLDKFS